MGLSIRLTALLVLLFSFFSSGSWANERALETKFSDILYMNDLDLSNFQWRITGQRLDDPSEIKTRTKDRVDELVMRVEELMDMYPSAFRFDIFLESLYNGSGPVALYAHPAKRITVTADRVTDGVLAHEIAHAVMCSYFPTPPPEKIQEILAQYVDQHLWGDTF